MTHHIDIPFWLGWIAGCVAMSALSGWWSLARAFPARPTAGRRWHFVSGSVRRFERLPIHYHATFFLTAGDEGFRLSVFFPVRLLHAPLFFPWSAVTGVRSRRFLYFFQQTEIDIANCNIKLCLRGKAGRAMLAELTGGNHHLAERLPDAPTEVCS